MYRYGCTASILLSLSIHSGICTLGVSVLGHGRFLSPFYLCYCPITLVCLLPLFSVTMLLPLPKLLTISDTIFNLLVIHPKGTSNGGILSVLVRPDWLQEYVF